MSDCTMRLFRFLLFSATLLFTPASFAGDIPSSGAPSLPALRADEVVSRMTAANQQRAALLRGYQGRRSYALQYQGFPSHREATMEVAVQYTAPDKKQLDVVGESGSRMLQNKVLMKLLESEREAAAGSAKRSSDLTADNYSFVLLGTRPSRYGGCYRLGVTPRRDEKFLYRGEICVNAADFAVESIDAEPARNPSFWIKKTRIEHRYQKIGDFWLPESNRTVTNVRIGGTATLRILYTKYDLQAK